MILNNISQSVLEVISNSDDIVPNKIREKRESLQNTLNKRFSIPMTILEEKKYSTDEEEHTNDSYTSVSADYTEKQTSRAEHETQHYFDDTKNMEYAVVSTDVRTLLEGDEKPINVKEHMIINMIKKNINNFNDLYNSNNNSIEEKNEVEMPYEEHIVNTQNNMDEIVFESANEVYEEKNSEINKYGMPANIEKALSSTFDFDTTMVAINQTRKEFKNVSEKADMATQAANESEELLQQISSEYSEAEKKLKEKEKRSQEMEQKIIEILNSEKDKINQRMQEKEILINDANRRKEQNNDKIVDFRSKINSTMEKSNEIDEKISRQEELLNTLVNFNINFEDYSLNDNEKVSGRIA
jgi:hypothetical protein